MTRLAPLLDTRSDRTRVALLKAFVRLIFRDGFDGMPVAAIATEAGVARSTFYEHFSGKEDILQASMAQFFDVMSACVSTEEQPPELTWVLSHFWENRRMADAVFSGHPRKILIRSLTDLIERRLRTSETSTKPLLPHRLAAIHVAEAQLALIDSWLRGRAFATPEDMAIAIHRSSRASAVALLAAS